MAGAVAAFLRAAGVPGSPEIEGTPERVAESWVADYLDGYAIAPRDALGPLIEARGSGLVCVTGLDFHSTCPHHLLPYRGLAHVAYLPSGRVVGFSRLGRLVDALAHRLVLQEALARQIAHSLRSVTGAAGAACVLEAEQACLSCRGRARRAARTTVEAVAGRLGPDLLSHFQRAIAAGARPLPREVAP